jgi:hypothetical protein
LMIQVLTIHSPHSFVPATRDDDLSISTTVFAFGVKISVAKTHRHAKGGQFVLHAKALPGNPSHGEGRVK